MDVRADRTGAPTLEEDRPFAVRAVSPGPKRGREGREGGLGLGPALPVAQQADDVDEGRVQVGWVCVAKGFRDYVAVRKKRNEMTANGGAMQRALKCHHDYME